MNGSTYRAISHHDYAQSTLGDIVFVELPKSADTVTAGETFGSVESVKAVSDLYSPVSGAVTEINEALNSSPDKINEDAHSPGSSKSSSPTPRRSPPCSTPQPTKLHRRRNRTLKTAFNF